MLSIQTSVASLFATEQFHTNSQDAIRQSSSGYRINSSGDNSAISDKISVVTSPNPLPGNYTIQVQDPGSFGSAVSTGGLSTVSDPTTQSISDATTFTLTVNGVTYTLLPPSQNLESLAGAINASGAGIEATIINVGSPSQPDYQLALQAASVGIFSGELNDGSQNLLKSLSRGSNAVYAIK